jgi:hypothetical protein
MASKRLSGSESRKKAERGTDGTETVAADAQNVGERRSAIAVHEFQ